MVAGEFNCYGIGTAGCNYVLKLIYQVYNMYREAKNIQWHNNEDYVFSCCANISSDGSGKGV